MLHQLKGKLIGFGSIILDGRGGEGVVEQLA